MTQSNKSRPSQPNPNNLYASITAKIKSLFSKVATNACPKSQLKKLLSNLEKQNNTQDPTSSLIRNCLDFTEQTAEDILVPRAYIFAVKSTTSIKQLNLDLLKNFHTRILVYRDNLDNIEGFIHIKDLYTMLISGVEKPLSELIRKPITVSSSIKLVDLMNKMRQNKTHLAVVVDEYGGTQGIVTNKDIVEALIGNDITDEHEATEKDQYKILGNSSLLVSARIKLDKIEELLQIKLDKQDYDCDTIGGLLTSMANQVPPAKAIFNISDKLQAEIVEANKRFIQKVKITLFP